MPAKGLTESKDPTLLFEQQCASAGISRIIGIDEVGRGAIAGPIAVGVALVDTSVPEFPAGLRDSKLISEKKREAIEPLLWQWCISWAVGTATAQEVDEHGVTRMLGEAARRGLTALHQQGHDVASALILLDGNQDWISPVLRSPLRVETRIKADRECATVAAASVLAKVSRDAMMREAHEEYPQYGWASNKGYGSQAHYAGIAEFGITPWHRASWIR